MIFVCFSVVKTVTSSSHKDSALSTSKKPAGGLDSILETLKGPKVVSTIAKSSNDWENYKEQEGLVDDLTAASKEGSVSDNDLTMIYGCDLATYTFLLRYLTRKDFLNRCDVRKFEKERDARAANNS